MDTAKKGAKNMKNRGSREKRSDSIQELVLPPGFSPNVRKDGENGHLAQTQDVLASESFQYYDAGCDCTATIEYLRSGRGKNKLSLKAATSEYQNAIGEATSSSNYGGCLSRSYLKKDRPFKEHEASPLLLNENDNIWFVVGLDNEFLCNEVENEIASHALIFLVDLVCNNDRIVGVFADLDYSSGTLGRAGCDRASQIQRLCCTCQAASRSCVPVQIRTSSAPNTTTEKQEGASTVTSSYLEEINDLIEVLSEITMLHPALRIHLSCWSGRADDMHKILKIFPENVWVGMDATVTFAKAKNAHESAFDVPTTKLLLETGSPRTIPSDVARTLGRMAFCHSGHVPHVAAALANLKRSVSWLTAEDVARAASNNTVILYELR